MLYYDLVDLYSPKKIIIEKTKSFQIGDFPLTHAAQFYSFFKSVCSKTSYEIENDFTYDVVVRCRFDLTWDPNQKFEIHDVFPFCVYVPRSFARYSPEQEIILIDYFFFGSSEIMNVLSNIYLFYMTEAKNKIDYLCVNNYGWKFLQPELMLLRYIRERGIQTFTAPHTAPIFLRKNASNLDPFSDFDAINKVYCDHYSPLAENQII